MKKRIQFFFSCIFFLQGYAQLLRGGISTYPYQKQLRINEVKHSAHFPEELEIVFPDSYEHNQDCSVLVLNDSYLCQIKHTKNSTITCDYPVYQVESYHSEVDQKCRAFCEDTPGCSILQKQPVELGDNQIRSLANSDPFSFSPQSASFVYPSYITIDLKQINQKITNVVLSNTQNTFETQILKQDLKSLVSIVKGGIIGNYTMQLVTSSSKFVSTSIFSLQIVITSVAPSQGSIDGGVFLTINGINFSMRDSENLIQIGNVPCTIFSSSLTQLVCITQKPDSNNLPVIGQPYDVVINYGNQQSVIQDSHGQFIFIQVTNKAEIDTIGSNIKGKLIQGETVVINGNNFQANGEETVLLIGGFKNPIDNLTQTQLNFTAGFDMPNTPQSLSIHVGSQGSTDEVQVVAPSMLLNSTCLNSGNNILYAQQQFINSYFFFLDLTLSNYDSTYSVEVAINTRVLVPTEFQITQDLQNKNKIYLRFNLYYYDINQIASIKIGGDEILDTPIPIQFTTSKPNIITTFLYTPIDSNSFALQYTPADLDLVVYTVLIRNKDYSIQIFGTISNGYFSFNKFPYTFDLSSGPTIEGCTNKGSFSTFVFLPVEAFRTAMQTLNILNNPFPQNKVYPGQKFKVQFPSTFIPISDFLCVECSGQYYPIFAENDLNSDNIYQFTIPPVPINSQTPFVGTMNCFLYHRSQWNSKGDSYLSKHTLFNDKLFQLQNFIQSFTMIEDTNKITITYQDNQNIIINSISPSSISYLGGDNIEFKGINLISLSASLVQVLINGISCTVTEATQSYIHCISGFQSKMQWLEESYVSVYLNGIKANMQAPKINIVMRQTDPLPYLGFLEFYNSSSKIYIPPDNSIIMDDVSQMNGKSVSFDIVSVDGTLVFQNSISYSVTLNQLIGNGQVLIGSSASPFGQSTFQLTVNYQNNLFNLTAYSTDTIVFANLISNALSGSNTINVLSSDIKSANLKIGDDIMIAGTTLESTYEKATIASISNNVITLTTNLTSDHIVASEVLKSKDGSTYNFNVNPSIFKIIKNVQINLNNQGQYSQTQNNYYPTSRSFSLSGVQLTLTEQMAQTSFAFNSVNSLITYSGGTCVSVSQSQNNVWINQITTVCFTLQGSINNSLFLSPQQNFVQIQGDIQLINNTFMKTSLKLLENNNFKQTSTTTKSSTYTTTILNGNIIYGTNSCIILPYSENSQIPMLLDNNLCFSCVYAIDALYTGFIQSSKYYLIAVNIQKGALVQLNNYGCYRADFFTLNLKNQGSAFLQSQLTNGHFNYKPAALSLYYDYFPDWSCLSVSNISNVEFKGFAYSSTDYIIENFQQNSNQRLFQFANIKQDFNGIFLPDNVNIVIRDQDGSFTGLKKQNNIVAQSSNLYDSTCTNQKDYSICQNSLIHAQQIYLLCIYQTGCNYSFTRQSNGLSLPTLYFGFFVSGEIYQVNLAQSSIQLFSVNFDYQQDSTKTIILLFPTNNNYLFHSVFQIFNANIQQMPDLLSTPSFTQQTAKLNITNCNHGDSFQDGTNIQVCLKQINTPATLYVSYYPDVYPIPAKVPIETRTREFGTSVDWIDNNMNMRSPNRYTILPHWRMQITKAGTYNIPSLVIQGSLEILGSADITLNLRGIYIGAGSLTVSPSYTGKLTINFVSTNSTEIIFNNPIERVSYNEGSIVINNKLNIQNTQNSQPYYRILKFYNINQQDVKNQIIVQNLKSASVSKGDSIFIVSPRTGYYLLTTVSDYPKQITFDSTLLTLKDTLSFTFSQVLDSFQLNSTSTVLLSPYVKIIKQRIQINNFNIYSLSHQFAYIPSVFLQGINFQDSQLTQQKIISSFTVQDCTFQISKDQDYYFNNPNTQYSQLSLTFSTSFTFINNLFLKTKNPLSINMFYMQLTGAGGPDPNYAYLYNANINYKINITNNLIVDCTNAISSYYYATLSNNVVIKSSNICSQSTSCPSHNGDAFYQCQVSGVSYDNCQSISNLLVAYSGTFFQGKIYKISNVQSISNPIHFQTYAGGEDTFISTIPLNQYNIQITNSIVILDLFETGSTCTPSSCIQLISPNSISLQVPTITIRDSKFYNIICSNEIFFQTNTPLNEIYHSSIAFYNTPCNNCQFKQLTNLISTSSQVPPSFLVQDYKSLFLGQNPNDSLSYIFTAQDSSPYIKVEHSSSILGRLFIQTLSTSNPNQFSLIGDSYNIQQISSLSGSILIFPLNNAYQLQSTSYAQTVYRMSSHNLQSLEYIQLQIPIGKEKGLKIRQNQTLLTPTPGLDTSNGYDIMSMVGSQLSKIQCGVNTYDTSTDSYNIILTNDPNCVIYLFEYTTTKVNIVIQTPILPPRQPEEVNMCEAQRQMLYVINMISQILGIDKRKIRMQSQSNFGTCTNSRILQSSTSSSDSISFTFVIDPDLPDDQSSCTFNPACSQSDIQAQSLQTSQQNMQTFQSLQTLQDKAVSSGLIITSIQTSLPAIVSTCSQDQYYQDTSCVGSCSTNYYAFQQQNQKICVKCHVACNTCTGPNSTDCAVQQNSQLLDCVDGFFTFKNNSGENYCGKCPSNCAIDCKLLQTPLCPENQCITEYANQNGYCLKQCFSTYFNYKNNGICKKCMTGCKDNCSDGTCSCGDGYYPLENQSEVCSPCPQQCATCSSDTKCLKCLESKYDANTICTQEIIQQEQKPNSIGLGVILGGTIGGVALLSLIYFVTLKTIERRKKKQPQRIKSQEIDTESNLHSETKQPEI